MSDVLIFMQETREAIDKLNDRINSVAKVSVHMMAQLDRIHKTLGLMQDYNSMQLLQKEMDVLTEMVKKLTDDVYKEDKDE